MSTPEESRQQQSPALGTAATSPLQRNLLAGTTTAVVLIPQAMAYSLVAGLPPIHGLYASILPLIGYALLGRSRELAVGPGALDTLLVGAGLGSLAFVTEENWVLWASVTALLVGLMQLALAAMRAGFLVNFLSRPVISGFTSAAAFVIALSQVRHLLGLQAESAPTLLGILGKLRPAISTLHPATALIGIGSVLALVALRRTRWKSSGPLLVVVAAILTSWFAGLEAQGVPVVGALPRGLPDWSWQGVRLDQVREVLPTAATVALVGYLTMISIAQTFANRRGVQLNANRELAAAGIANLLAGASRSFPVSASFSRSAVHATGEPASPRALIVTAGWVVLTLMALGPLIGPLPRATLAAIIIVAVSGLVDRATPARLWRYKRADFYLLLLTFAATLLIGVEPGILSGVAASLALLLYRTTRPHVAVLGRLGDSADFRNVRNYPQAQTIPGVLVVRMDAQFYFGNVTFLRTLLSQLEAQSTTPLRAVILEASAMNQLDSSANDALAEIVSAYHERGVRFAMSTVKMPVMRVLRASGLYDVIAPENFFMNVSDAVNAVAEQQEIPS